MTARKVGNGKPARAAASCWVMPAARIASARMELRVRCFMIRTYPNIRG